MLWFILWSVLAVAALGVGFLLWRHVYRAARAAMVEVRRAAELVAALTSQVESPTTAAEPFTPRAGLSHDLAEARAHVAALGKERERRAGRRRRAHSRTYQHWDDYQR